MIIILFLRRTIWMKTCLSKSIIVISQKENVLTQFEKKKLINFFFGSIFFRSKKMSIEKKLVEKFFDRNFEILKILKFRNFQNLTFFRKFFDFFSENFSFFSKNSSMFFSKKIEF